MASPGVRIYLASFSKPTQKAGFQLVVNGDTQDHSVLKLVGNSDRRNGEFTPGGNGWSPATPDLTRVRMLYFEASYWDLVVILNNSGDPQLRTDIFSLTEEKYEPEFEQLKKRKFFVRIERGIGTTPSKLQLCVHQQVSGNVNCIPKMASIDGGYALQKMFPERPLCDDIQPLCSTPTLSSVEKHWTVAGSTRLFSSESEANDFVKRAVLKH